MPVRAKFSVASVTRVLGGGSVVLQPVVSGSPENEQFYKYTPGGRIELSTVNEAALVQFEPGKLFYIDFTEAS
jgi:hypothetical protein